MKPRNTLALSAAIGVLAGLRTFTPPAVLSQVAKRNLLGIRRSRLRPFQSSITANTLTTLAVGELIGDKLPFTPSRLQVPSLAIRAASGALCGSIISASGKSQRSLRRNSSSSIAAGAIFGALGAIGGSFGGYYLRRELSQRFAIPDPAVAIVEDMVAVAGSAAIASKRASKLSYATAGLF